MKGWWVRLSSLNFHWTSQRMFALPPRLLSMNDCSSQWFVHRPLLTRTGVMSNQSVAGFGNRNDTACWKAIPWNHVDHLSFAQGPSDPHNTRLKSSSTMELAHRLGRREMDLNFKWSQQCLHLWTKEGIDVFYTFLRQWGQPKNVNKVRTMLWSQCNFSLLKEHMSRDNNGH